MRDILALEGKRSPPAAIQLLSCALFNSAMPCTGMIGLSVSLHGISLHACAACVVCLCVSVCARATCGCALRARGFLCSSVLYLYSCTCIVFLKCRYIGAFTFFLVFSLFVCLRFCARAGGSVGRESFVRAASRTRCALAKSTCVLCILYFALAGSFQLSRRAGE